MDVMHPSGCSTKHWAHTFGEVFGFPSMGLSRLAIILLCALLTSCAAQQEAYQPPPPEQTTCEAEGPGIRPVGQQYVCDSGLHP